MTKALLLVSLMLAASGANAGDGFDGVRCGSDVAHVLTGRRISNERTQVLEARHRPLGLSDLPADEISDHLNSESWRICGIEFVLLVDSTDVIRDVLALPGHSRRTPEFSGMCTMRNRRTSYTVEAILDAAERGSMTGPAHYSPSGQTLLPAIAAWKIDETNVKFVALDPTALRCPRSGIAAIDGGP
jgi:hypothetical protein